MSAKVTDPHELFAPDGEAKQQVLHLLRDYLTDEGRVAFSEEILAALAVSKSEGDLRQLNRVVEAWTRTALLVLNKTFQEKAWTAHLDSHDTTSKVLTLEDIK